MAGQPAVGRCPAVSARANPRADRTSYRIDAELDLAANQVRGRVVARFTPDLDTDQVVLRVWANSPRLVRAGSRQELPEITIDGRHEPVSRPDATTWIARPSQRLTAGRPVEVVAEFELNLPGTTNDRISRTGDSIRLGSFFPILPWEPGRGWSLDPATSAFAESSVAPTADFDVRLGVPQGLTVMASGVRDAGGRWRADAVRDFAASIGRFRIASGSVDSGGRPVAVTVGVAESLGDDPGVYLDKLSRVLTDFDARFGSYPWPAYSLAITPGLRGGIEYPMHVMQGPGYLGRTTSHEVGHMWFYGLVGNNQGRDPVLDEGLGTWAEARFEQTLGQIASTEIPEVGRGRAGEPMSFWEGHQSAYYRSVYVQGAAALAALGSADLVDCALRHYVANHAYSIVTQEELVKAMEIVFPNARAVLRGYGIG